MVFVSLGYCHWCLPLVLMPQAQLGSRVPLVPALSVMLLHVMSTGVIRA